MFPAANVLNLYFGRYLTCLTDEMSNVSVLMEFIKSNPECIRHRAKCTSYYFVGGGFDPIRDVNIEFLFRGGPCVLQLADDEKICVVSYCSLSFIELNSAC